MDTLELSLYVLIGFFGMGLTLLMLQSERRRASRLAHEETMRRRAKRREAIKATVAQLRKIERDFSHDPEELRLRSNGAVAGLLVQLGCTDVVDVWEWIACQKK